MKKIALLLISTLVLMLALVGCNKTPDNGTEAPDNRPTYTITFDLGSKKETVKVKEGDMPTPPTIEDADYGNFLKRHDGWDKEIVPATENTTYRAVYKNVTKQYNITFVLAESTVTLPANASSTPVPPTDIPDYNGMKFLTWDRKLELVNGDATYTALYYDPELIDADKLDYAYNRHLMAYGSASNNDDNYGSTLYTATMLYTLVWHEHMNPQGGAMAARIIEHFTNVTSPDKAPSFDACCYWNYNPLTASVALARTTPTIWNKIPVDIQLRLQTMMLAFTYLESFATSDYNYYQTGPGMGGNFHKDWNPNYRLANIPVMVYATYFFGAGDIELGAQTVNSNIKSFDAAAYDSIIATFQKYGWRRATLRWTSDARVSTDGKNVQGLSAKELLVNGGQAVGEDTSIDSDLKVALGTGAGVANKDINGVPRDYLYKTFSLYEPEKIVQHLLCYNYGGTTLPSGQYMASSFKEVVSGHWFDKDGDGIKDLVAWIADDTSSPYEGMEGMMTEFASGNRSSTAYTGHDFVLTTIMLTAVRAMELYDTDNNGKKTPIYNEDGTAKVLFDYTKNETLWSAIQVGNEDHIYKLIHGYQGYSTGSYGEAFHVGKESDAGADYWVCKSIWRTYMMKDGSIPIAESFGLPEQAE